VRHHRLGGRICLAAVLPLLLAGVLATVAATPAAAAVPTSITVTVEPPTVLEPYTPATFRADVTPSDAQGLVTFTFDGAVLGTAPVVGGQAVFESASHPVGLHRLRAAFAPVAGSGFAPSVSSAVDVTVQGIARLALARKGGAQVPPGSQVRVGEDLVVSALSFPPFSRVSFTLAGRTIPLTIATNSAGNGSAPLRVTRDLPSAVYLLSASGGKRSAGFVFYVYNPPAATPTTTAPVVVMPPAATPTAPTVQAPVTTTQPTASSPGLAQTGSAAALLAPWGLLLVTVGAGLARLGPVKGGRHARR